MNGRKWSRFFALQAPLWFLFGPTGGAGGSAAWGMQLQIQNAKPFSSPVFFRETFEGPVIQMFTAGGAQWETGNPGLFSVPNGPSAAAQGSNCAGTRIGGFYDNSAHDVLYTPEIDFGGADLASLTFRNFYSLEPSFDGGRLLASPDVGVSWQILQPVEGYPEPNVFVFGGGQGYSGSSRGVWKSVGVNLAPLLAQSPRWIFAWEFASDTSVTDAGWYVDDIRIAGEPPPPVTVFSENFEGPVLNFIAATGTLWEVDDPSLYAKPNAPSAAAEGSRCAGTRFSEPYPNNGYDLLYSSQIDLTGAAAAKLTFRHHFSIEAGYDGGRILASPDQGQTWYLVQPQEGYPAPYVQVFGTAAFSGSSGGWQTVDADLTSLLSLGPMWTIGFEFASDGSVQDAGWYIDLVSVSKQ